MVGDDFIRVTDGEPHAARARRTPARHPELRPLAFPQPLGAFRVIGLVAARLGFSIVVADRPWYDDVRWNRSRTALLPAFLRDRRVTLFSRVVRPSH